MSYIGRGISNLSDRAVLDSITTSATATYNLLLNTVAYVPSSAESLTVSLNGVIQAPTISYTVSGSTIVFASNLASSDVIDFILAERAITLTTIGSGTVTTSNIVDSNITTQKIANNAITSEKLASGLALGKIGQVVQAVKTDIFATSSSSFSTITGLSVNITPTATSSKILIRTLISYGGQANMYGFGKILRGSTEILIGDAGESSQSRATFPMMVSDGDSSAGVFKSFHSGAEFLDSPSSSSQLTYSITCASGVDGRDLYINRPGNNTNAAYIGRLASTITAMEVLA